MCAKAVESNCIVTSSSSNMLPELVKLAVIAVPTILIVFYLWKANEKRRLSAPVEETSANVGTKSIIV